MQYFLFELTAGGEEELETEKGLLKRAEKMARLPKIWIHIKQSLVLASSALEIELKLIITNRGRASLDDLLMIENMTREMTKLHPASIRYAKSLISIISHLAIYRLSTQGSDEKMMHLCNLLIRDEGELTRLLTL